MRQQCTTDFVSNNAKFCPSVLSHRICKLLLVAGFLMLGGCETLGTKEDSSTTDQAVVSVTDGEKKEVITLSPGTQLTCDCPPPKKALACEDKPTPAPAPVTVCKPQPKRVVEEKELGDRLIIGRVEHVVLTDGLTFKARIDTGAGLTSLHATDLVQFERDGKAWVRFAIQEGNTKQQVTVERPVKRFINIKQLSGEPQRRPIVLMTIKMGQLEERVEVTLTDRSGYLYEVLVGRNFLRDRAIVDVSKKFTTKVSNGTASK